MYLNFRYIVNRQHDSHHMWQYFNFHTFLLDKSALIPGHQVKDSMEQLSWFSLFVYHLDKLHRQHRKKVMCLLLKQSRNHLNMMCTYFKQCLNIICSQYIMLYTRLHCLSSIHQFRHCMCLDLCSLNSNRCKSFEVIQMLLVQVLYHNISRHDSI